MVTKYEIVIASARSYLAHDIEDFVYGISLLVDLSELDQTEEVINLIKEVDKKNAALVDGRPIEVVLHAIYEYMMAKAGRCFSCKL